MALKCEEQMGYSWANSADGSGTLSRQLTNFERMFVIFNQALHGQNCPFFGATISLRRQDHSLESPSLNISWLQKRAVEAFCQTRWKYPTVAARVVDGDKALYHVESQIEVKKWADRTVSTVTQEGGWMALRETLSRSSPIPTKDGDFCLFYLIVRPVETQSPEITTFDVLMHTHHVFTDGSGIRTLFNEFVSRLADPLAPGEIIWGEEVERLLPASIVLEKEEETESTLGVTTAPVAGEKLKGYFKPDVGLPVYRPDIAVLNPEQRGTILVSHTFENDNFLPKLLAVGRKHGVKLTAVLHAALLKAVYDSVDITPSSEDVFKSGSALDLRNGYMISPYGERREYVNSAVAIQPIEVPCHLFQTKDELDGFWKAATYIGNQWDVIKKKKNMAKAVEGDAKAFINSWESNSSTSPKVVAKPRTCPYFVSDPPGSHLLNATYPISGYEGISLSLDSYQLATDQTQAVVSARSHSWKDKLTLCVAFNAIRNPKEKMEEFLGKWVNIVEKACTGC